MDHPFNVITKLPGENRWFIDLTGWRESAVKAWLADHAKGEAMCNMAGSIGVIWTRVYSTKRADLVAVKKAFAE